MTYAMHRDDTYIYTWALPFIRTTRRPRSTPLYTNALTYRLSYNLSYYAPTRHSPNICTYVWGCHSPPLASWRLPSSSFKLETLRECVFCTVKDPIRSAALLQVSSPPGETLASRSSVNPLSITEAFTHYPPAMWQICVANLCIPGPSIRNTQPAILTVCLWLVSAIENTSLSPHPMSREAQCLNQQSPISHGEPTLGGGTASRKFYEPSKQLCCWLTSAWSTHSMKQDAGFF